MKKMIRISSDINPLLKKAVYRKKRHSCPGNFLTIPSEKEVTKMERKLVKLSRLRSTKKDLTKGIGMHKILGKMERKKIQKIRRQKRRSERKSESIQNDK